MDKKEQISQVARSLKELHLAANMEEAMKRAKEIVESAQEGGKSVKELLNAVDTKTKEQVKEADSVQKESDSDRQELSKEASEEHKNIDKDTDSAEKDHESAKETKEEVKTDIKVHNLEKGEVKEAMENVDQINCAVEDTKFIVEEAEKIQKKEEE